MNASTPEPQRQTSSSAKLVRIVLSLGIVALIIFIAQQVWAFGQSMGSVFSTLAASWFLALIVRPFIHLLVNAPLLPKFVAAWVRNKYGDSIARRVGAARIPFGMAVGITYIIVLVVLIGGITIGIAAIVPQATALISAVPNIAAQLPDRIPAAWADAAQRLGLDPNSINQFVSAQEISSRIAQLAQLALNQAVSIATFTASALGQIFLVIVLSLYIVIEDKLIERQFFAILPQRMHNGVNALFVAVQRSFSGYLRGQVVAGLIRAVITVIVFAAFGVNFGIVVGVVYGVLSFIPLIGSPIGVLIAAVVALIFQPSAVLPIAIILLVVDLIVAYFVLPQLLSDAVGVPSLIGLISISLGVNLLGFWGLVFSIPIVGAVYAVVFDFYLPRRRAHDGLPDMDEEFRALVYPRRGTRKSTVRMDRQKINAAIRSAATWVAHAATAFWRWLERAWAQLRALQKR
jgi:predicted PurR-regulated permease PerM